MKGAGALLLLCLLPGCAVTSAAGAVVGAAATVVETGVRATGAVVEGAVNVVAGDDED